LIYASISGYGHSGVPEWSKKPGYDLVIQGMGGMASITGTPDGPPLKSGLSISDLVAGLYAMIGILVALHARQRTGRGQHVDVSMLDGQISLLTFHSGSYFATGNAPVRRGNRHPSIVPYETFQAADGWVNIACGNDALFRALCTSVPELARYADDAKFSTNAQRVAHRAELEQLLDPLIAARPVADWIALCEKAGIPCGPILDVADALTHPQTLARNMVVPVEHPKAGAMRTLGVPVRLSETPGAVTKAAPLLGQHTRATLRELLALSDDDFSALEKEGVVRGPGR
jgi:crotonobetainyl-CoA:carnitine CoA-transferase CaiB-like acyl-CoA transferase